MTKIKRTKGRIQMAETKLPSGLRGVGDVEFEAMNQHGLTDAWEVIGTYRENGYRFRAGVFVGPTAEAYAKQFAALPMLVEAARRLAGIFPPDDSYVAPLRDALALIDGKGG
jgi:hypothetical protein